MPEGDQNQEDRSSGDGRPQRPPPNGYPPGYYPEEDVISLLDLLLILARNRTFILAVAGSITVLGLLMAVSSPDEYMSEATVVRETEGEGAPSIPGGLGGLAGSMGISLGGAGSGLTAQAYPEVLESREVRLAVVTDTYRIAHLDTSMSYVEYLDRPEGWLSWVMGGIMGYTIGLPGKVLGLFSGESQSRSAVATGDTLRYPTEAEEEAIATVSNQVSTSVNQETGLMTISVTTGQPRLSAALAQSFADHLSSRVSEIRTQKARQNLNFIKQRFQEAEEELRDAEEQLAQFLDQNTNPQTARLRTEQDRLQRQVDFKSQLYSELQSQLTQARLNVQRSEPAITVVERPVPPMEPTGPNRMLTVLLSVVLGGFLGVGGAFVRNAFSEENVEDEEKEKLEEVREAFVPSMVREVSGRWSERSRSAGKD